MHLSSEAQSKLKALAEQVARQEGVLLYDIEVAGRILRILIDREEGHVGIDDCSNVSKALNLLLDVEDFISGSYHLEVSSPGLERKLNQVWQFKKALSERVRVKLVAAKRWNESESEVGPSQQTMEGTLFSVDENQIELREGRKFCQISWPEIMRAQLVFRPEVNKKR